LYFGLEKQTTNTCLGVNLSAQRYSYTGIKGTCSWTTRNMA